MGVSSKNLSAPLGNWNGKAEKQRSTVKKIKKERLPSILKADADFYYSVIEREAESHLRPL